MRISQVDHEVAVTHTFGKQASGYKMANTAYYTISSPALPDAHCSAYISVT